ncbi:hypothetical protein CTI14_44795 [Methylobacterium radiotolerans]|nr:hypothetical protein CTI14_44795 [Methylobacterium radiotolerans]
MALVEADEHSFLEGLVRWSKPVEDAQQAVASCGDGCGRHVEVLLAAEAAAAAARAISVPSRSRSQETVHMPRLMPAHS